MEHPTSSTIADLRQALADRDATIASLQAALNEMHIRAVDAERCRVKAGHTRALAAQIARGDDDREVER